MVERGKHFQLKAVHHKMPILQVIYITRWTLSAWTIIDKIKWVGAKANKRVWPSDLQEVAHPIWLFLDAPVLPCYLHNGLCLTLQISSQSLLCWRIHAGKSSHHPNVLLDLNCRKKALQNLGFSTFLPGLIAS